MINYLTGNLWLAWLILAVLCLIIEVSSFDFFVTCFAIGALGAMLCTWLGLPLWVQVLVWAAVSVASIFFIRPALSRCLHRSDGHRKSNADALVGKTGVVTETIGGDGHGYVKIDGDEWRSVSSDGQPIKKGRRVTVVSRESIILTVAKIDN